MSKEIDDRGVLTCPNCHSRTEASMPGNACVIVVKCPQCYSDMRPKAGDCCVFCSYGDKPCPPIQVQMTGKEE